MAHKDTTIVFVPGAWHSPDGYDSVIGHLQKAGYNTSKVYTPSVLANGGVPHQTFDADVAEIRKHLTIAVDAGQKVVLVMHSYGGQPSSQAAEGFDQASMVAKGYTDGRGLVHLVYLASFMLRAGESLADTATEPVDWIEVMDDLSCFPKNPAHVFYNDYESSTETELWISRLRPFSIMVNTSKLSHEPWKRISTTYLVCEKDNAISAVQQRGFVRNAIDAGAVDLRVINWNCGHTPFGVRPLETSRLIRAAVGDVESLPLVTKNIVNETVTEMKDEILVPVS